VFATDRPSTQRISVGKRKLEVYSVKNKTREYGALSLVRMQRGRRDVDLPRKRWILKPENVICFALK
jgi:hypothetical protein